MIAAPRVADQSSLRAASPSSQANLLIPNEKGSAAGVGGCPLVSGAHRLTDGHPFPLTRRRFPCQPFSSRDIKGRSATRRRVRHPLSGAVAVFPTGRGSSTQAWTSGGVRRALCTCARYLPLCSSGGHCGREEREGRLSERGRGLGYFTGAGSRRRPSSGLNHTWLYAGRCAGRRRRSSISKRKGRWNPPCAPERWWEVRATSGMRAIQS